MWQTIIGFMGNRKPSPELQLPAYWKPIETLEQNYDLSVDSF